MDFLRNLGSAIKTGVKSVGTTLANVARNTLIVAKGGQLANASSALNFDNPMNNALQAGRNANSTPVPNMTVAPDPSRGESGGPGVNGVSIGGNWYYNQGREQAIATASGDIRPSTAPTNSGVNQTPMPEPPKWTPPTDDYGRVASKDQGFAYYDAKGNYIVPKVGFSGLSGGGGEGFTSVSPQGQQGQPGGGGSAFTGLLGAAGGAAGSSTAMSEEERINKQNGKTGTQILTPSVTRETAGAVNALNASVAPKFTAPTVPETIDAGWLSKVQETISSVSRAGSSLSDNERSVIIGQLSNNLIAAKQKLDQQTAMPEQPVVDTQEQLDFINKSEDPFGVRQAIDSFKASQTNLGELHKTRVELMKNVQALNEAYAPIIKDIKNNPDLPKGLARRRLEDLADTQKTTLQGFLDQLEIVGQQISDQDEMVNRNFQIVTFANTQQNQFQDNMRANLQIMINSGAIAGFSTKDINGYAKALGIDASALLKAKEDALKPKTDQSVIGTSETGYFSVVTNEETGAIISKTQILPPVPKSTNPSDSSNAVGAWSSFIDSSISKGDDVNTAVDYAIYEANQRGVKLTTKELSDLRAYAQKKKGATPPPSSDPIDRFLFNTNPTKSSFSLNPSSFGMGTQSSTPAFINKKK